MTPNGQHLSEPVMSRAHTGFTLLHEHFTVQQALVEIRKSGVTHGIIYFYVVDDANRLVGVLPTKRRELAVSVRNGKKSLRVVRSRPSAIVLEGAGQPDKAIGGCRFVW
jgi:hypothetical protein